MTTHVIYEKSGFEVFGAIQLQYHQHQHTGHFKNGRYPNHSFGKGAVFSHFTGGIKTWIAYSFDGHHHFTTRMGFWKRPAAVGSYYLNLREAEIVNPFVSTENAFVFEGSYRLTREKVRGRFTLYSISLRNGNRQGFYYADGIQGHQAFFVQEHLNGIHRRYRGFEFAGQYEPIEGVAFLGVATVGTARYMSNPHLLHQTAPTAASRLSGFDNGTQVFGFSYLQGYPLANGPQQAYSLGFEYKDPNYWRMGLHVNYFSHAYVAINAFRRTRNFYQDFDGIPFADYDSKEAESILAPERIPSYFTLNATASKSWRLGKQYVGFFISVQNLLNSIQKRGDLNKRVMPIIKPCW